MPITWDEFDRMFGSVLSDVEQLKQVASTADSGRRSDYDRHWSHAFDTASKILESTPTYTPPIDKSQLRDNWMGKKAEARRIRKWLIDNKETLWKPDA